MLLNANNEGANHPAHQRSLINANAVHSLESIIAKLAICKNSIFQLVFVAQQARLKPGMVTNHEERYLMMGCI